jgi:hypothetical protein
LLFLSPVFVKAKHDPGVEIVAYALPAPAFIRVIWCDRFFTHFICPGLPDLPGKTDQEKKVFSLDGIWNWIFHGDNICSLVLFS